MFSKSVRAAFITLTALAISISATQSLSVKVTGPEAIDTVEHLKVVATITNTGDEILKVLNDPSGPLNKLPTDTFVINDSKGAQPSFTGIKLKYVPETAAAVGAYTTLAPGESVEVEHDLIHTYNFTASGAASYDISASNTFYVVNADSTISTLHAEAESHSTNISGKLAVARPTLVKRATYNGCTPAQRSTLESARPVAKKYAVRASNYAKSHTSSTSRYKTWFGAYTNARHDVVASNLLAISRNTFSNYEFDCTCPATTASDIYAYVYPNEFGIIYLCDLFWKAPMKGTDSKGGTIVHEASHFTKNGGTDDYAYGKASCRALAKNRPGLAVKNADSYQYFAENNPRRK